jgi:hypothetical protein
MTIDRRSLARQPDLAPLRFTDRRFDLETSPLKIEQHLNDFLSRLRLKAQGLGVADVQAAVPCTDWGGDASACRPSHRDCLRIRERAQALATRRESASGLAHLSEDARKQLKGLQHVRAIQPTSAHRADEIAAILHAEMPWMARATIR